MQVTPMKSIHSVADSIRTMQREEHDAAEMARTKNSLIRQMKVVLANGYVFYYKAHAFHWNIEGSNFPQYHEFLEKIYTTVYEKLDATAEQIRAIGGYAPPSLTALCNLASVLEEMSVPTPSNMLGQLSSDNEKVIGDMMSAYRLAEQAGELGLSNYLQDRINDHKKLGWMISSTVKGE
jgi:starvation-inducible DNA-binding protein